MKSHSTQKLFFIQLMLPFLPPASGLYVIKGYRQTNGRMLPRIKKQTYS